MSDCVLTPSDVHIATGPFLPYSDKSHFIDYRGELESWIPRIFWYAWNDHWLRRNRRHQTKNYIAQFLFETKSRKKRLSKILVDIEGIKMFFSPIIHCPFFYWFTHLTLKGKLTFLTKPSIQSGKELWPGIMTPLGMLIGRLTPLIITFQLAVALV